MNLGNNRRKIAVFIDSGNLWNAYKSIHKLLDFSKFKPFFENKFDGEIFKIFYYVAFPQDGTRKQGDIERLHKFFTYLKKGLGFEVIKKPLKMINQRDRNGNLIYDQKTGIIQTIEKGNFDVELTIDAMRYSSAYDTAILLSGDSDFLPLISHLRNLKNKKLVYIFSTEGSVSMELKTGTDGYFDLKEYSELHGKDLIEK
jgi:uncharacterized LabA/DUF88 family protein